MCLTVLCENGTEPFLEEACGTSVKLEMFSMKSFLYLQHLISFGTYLNVHYHKTELTVFCLLSLNLVLLLQML